MFINYLRKEEISRIHLIGDVQRLLNDDEIDNPQVKLLLLNILEDNKSIPIIMTDRFDNPIMMKNIPVSIEQNHHKMEKMISDMRNSYEPIEVVLPSGDNQYIYYSNSRLLNNLRYYPIALGLFITAYFIFSIWFLRTLKRTDEGFVWAGLAKETAHQIGTPLSSMIGWIEIIKMENENSTGVKEIEKDIERLKTITERFSKIGSDPELTDLNLKETLYNNYDYLKHRVSSKINFTLKMPSTDVLIPHNKVLINWVIENITKNAVDAMKGIGNLEIDLFEKGKNIIIDITDNGCGMTKAQARNIFKPGFSTKKRGWGLGLSLAKRAIKENHSGTLKVLHTEVGKGTTFRIILSQKDS